MGGIASNDAELAAILAPAVMQGLQNMGEFDLEPAIENIINALTHRGSHYFSSGGGTLAEAWSTKSYVGGGINLGEMETYYDSGELRYNSSIGMHATPADYARGKIEYVSDMATLIDKGLGGMLFGPDNPTREATGFWDVVLSHFQSHGDAWIRKQLIAAGLPLV